MSVCSTLNVVLFISLLVTIPLLTVGIIRLHKKISIFYRIFWYISYDVAFDKDQQLILRCISGCTVKNGDKITVDFERLEKVIQRNISEMNFEKNHHASKFLDHVFPREYLH